MHLRCVLVVVLLYLSSIPAARKHTHRVRMCMCMCVCVSCCMRSIPAGMDVYLATRSLQMDPVIWPRADEYLPERWLPGNEDLAPRQANAYLPFGLGNRHCPG